MASWSDLPTDLLGLVAGRLSAYPVDHARCAAVCRSWRAAVREHDRRRLPWIIACSEQVFLPFNGLPHSFQHLPEDGGCSAVGSTDDWLLVGLGTEHEFENMTKWIYRGYVLHNPFSNTTVPLTVLDDVITNIGTCLICKFLMRSTVDDFIVVVTDNINYPIIVFRQGKGAWVPPVDAAPYIYIIDVAFLGDTLYAITKAEDLIPLNLTLDCDGTPVVTIGKRVIRQPPGYDDYDAWSASDDDVDDEGHDIAYDDDDDSEEVEIEEVADDDDNDNAEEEENDKVVDDDDDDAEEEKNEEVLDEKDDDVEEEEKEVALDQAPQEEEDGSHPFSFSAEETDARIIISRHLIVSRGKLLLVRRHEKPTYDYLAFTHRVDVLEADANIGVWVPLPVGAGLGGGRALFISMNFSKFVSAPCGQVEEDVVYDIHTGEVFDMKSQTSREGHFCICFQAITWLFPPELVL